MNTLHKYKGFIMRYILPLMILSVLIYTSCDDEANTICNDSSLSFSEKELNELIDSKVENKFNERVQPDINISVSDALTNLVPDIVGYNKDGNRLINKKLKLNDNSIVYSLYDKELEELCSLTKLNNKYCCVPKFSRDSVWTCDSNNGCFLNNYDPLHSHIKYEYWEGFLDKDNKPCISYENNCVEHSYDLYLCKIENKDNKLIANRCLHLSKIDDWFVCEI